MCPIRFSQRSPDTKAGERAFIEVALNDFPGLVMTPILAWISETRDPAGAMLHNLSDSSGTPPCPP